MKHKLNILITTVMVGFTLTVFGGGDKVVTEMNLAPITPKEATFDDENDDNNVIHSLDLIKLRPIIPTEATFDSDTLKEISIKKIKKLR